MGAPGIAIDPTAALIALARLAKEPLEVKLEDIRTEADVRKLDAKTLARLVQNPETRDHLNRAMQFRDAEALAEYEKTQADAAAAEQAAVEAQQNQAAADEAARLSAEQAATAVATPVVPTWQAEDESYKAMNVTVVRDALGNITRLVTDYQVTDEQGNPVGRPTHLEARNWPELYMKQREAHIQASRAFGRLKKAQLTRKEVVEPQPIRQLTDAEVADLVKDLKSDDPTKSVAAARKLALADPAVVKAQQDAYEAKIKSEAALVTYQFLQKHIHDFNNCAANQKLLGEYFEENNLKWTLDNLEIAFAALEDQLAPVAQVPARAVPSVENAAPVTTAASAAPAAPAAAAAAAPAVPAPQAAPAQPATPPQPENKPPVRVEPRPGVNSGILPGTLTGKIVDVPSTATSGQLTARDIYKWDPKILKARMRDPQWIPIIEAAGIRIINKFRQG